MPKKARRTKSITRMRNTMNRKSIPEAVRFKRAITNQEAIRRREYSAKGAMNRRKIRRDTQRSLRRRSLRKTLRRNFTRLSIMMRRRKRGLSPADRAAALARQAFGPSLFGFSGIWMSWTVSWRQPEQACWCWQWL